MVASKGALAGGEGARLLGVQRGAVHVAWLPRGGAGEAQDGRVVDEPVGDGHGLPGRGQERPPLLERQVRNDNRRALTISSAHDPEELVGGGAAEVRKSRIIEDQEIRGGDAAKDFAVGTVGPGRVQGPEHLGGGA